MTPADILSFCINEDGKGGNPALEAACLAAINGNASAQLLDALHSLGEFLDSGRADEEDSQEEAIRLYDAVANAWQEDGIRPTTTQSLEDAYQEYRAGDEPDGCFFCGGNHPSTDCKNRE